jgi:hypothetical protein
MKALRILALTLLSTLGCLVAVLAFSVLLGALTSNCQG